MMYKTQKKSTKKNNSVNTKTIFIGGLDLNSTESQLLEYFTKFGKIQTLKLKRRKNEILNLGFGYLETDLDTYTLILAKPNHQIYGRKIDCKPFLRGEKLREYGSEYQKRRLYITGLPLNSEKELTFYLSNFGEIQNCYLLIKDKPKHLSTKALVLFKAEKTTFVLYDLATKGKLNLKGNILSAKWKLPNTSKSIYQNKNKAQKSIFSWKFNQEKRRIQPNPPLSQRIQKPNQNGIRNRSEYTNERKKESPKIMFSGRNQLRNTFSPQSGHKKYSELHNLKRDQKRESFKVNTRSNKNNREHQQKYREIKQNKQIKKRDESTCYIPEQRTYRTRVKVLNSIKPTQKEYYLERNSYQEPDHSPFNIQFNQIQPNKLRKLF